MMDDFESLSSTRRFYFMASVGTTCERMLKSDRPSVIEQVSFQRL